MSSFEGLSSSHPTKKFILFATILLSNLLLSQNACFHTYAKSTFSAGPGQFNYNAAQSWSYGDVNSDGIEDAVITNYQTSSGLIYLGNNSSSFFSSPANTFTLYANPTQSAMSDLNNDGNQDLVVIYANSALVSIHFSNGTGGFSSVATYSTAYNSFVANSGFFIGDFNNDTYPDIYTYAPATNTDFFLLNNGTGSFSMGPSPIVLLAGNSLSSIPGDFDNDNNLDFVTLKYTPYTLTFNPGLGSANFGTPVSSAYTLQPFSGNFGSAIGKGDLNGDGNLDLFLSGSGSCIFMMGSGTGSFIQGQTLTFHGGPANQIIVDDLNNDTQPDILLEDGSQYVIFTNLGAGVFSPPSYFSEAVSQSSPLASIIQLKLDDLNGDLIKDLLFLQTSGYAADLVAQLSQPYTTYGGAGNSQVTVTDLDNDNINEIVGMDVNNALITIFRNNPSGTYLATQSYSVPGCEWMEVADFNNDNLKDLAVSLNTGAGGSVSILMGTAGGNYTAAPTFSLLNNSWAIAAADFDNNGTMDLAAPITSGFTNKLQIFSGLGNGSFNLANTLNTNNGPTKVHIADANGDGKPDMFVTYAGVGYITRYLGNGAGGFSAPVNINVTPTYTLYASDMDMGDVNADNKTDIVSIDNNGNLTIFTGDGLGGFSLAATYTSNVNIGNPKITDLNADGYNDIIIGLGSIGFGPTTIAYMGNGSGSVPSLADTVTVLNDVSLAVGKLDADNLPEFLTNQIIYRNTTSTITTASGFSFCAGASLMLSGPAGANSYTWMPGGANTSTLSAATAGTYSLITNVNNCISASSAVTVVALPAISPSVTPASPTVCVGSSATFTASGVTSYTWNTGVTTSTLSVLTLSSTTYSVSSLNTNGCTGTQTVMLTIDNTCADVWPGDANSDGQADNLDVLELGLHYAQTGPARSTTSNSWQSYYAGNWPGTITNGQNLNHSDCDGSGTIDQNDTLAIYNNYGLTHSFRAENQQNINPDLNITPDQPMLGQGQWGSASIHLGDSTNTISNINGLAFTLGFDNTLIETDSIYLAYLPSFLNAAGPNLNFRKSVFGNGSLYTATTHTNNVNVSGAGIIARLSFKTKQAITSNADLIFNIGHAKKSNSSGVISPMSSGGATVQIVYSPLGIAANSMSEGISLFPNPTSGKCTISGVKPSDLIELMTITGQVLYSDRVTDGNKSFYQLNLQPYDNGIYFIRVGKGEGSASYLKKLVKN